MAVTIGIARAAANAADRCGDAARAWQWQRQTVIAIADGLGHGTEAAEAADAALDYIGAHLDTEPLVLFQGMHRALGCTRGAAVGVAIVAPDHGRLTYLAVGNTRAGIFGWRVVRLDSYPGIVGGGYRRLAPTVVPMRPGDQLVLWTDGVDERLTMTGQPAGDAQPQAERLLHAYGLGRDDSCVVVAQLDAS